MSFFSRLLGFSKAPAPSSSPASQSLTASSSSLQSKSGASSATSRRELLRVVLRDTLNRHGIPGAWISGETVVSTSRTREQGIHWRLVINHWDTRLLTHAVALQQSLIKRAVTFDPLAADWLMGISWQFSLADESVCPPMPHPGLWTAEPSVAAPPPADPVAGGSADVIAGPLRIVERAAKEPSSAEATKAELEQLFAVRDADFKRHAEGHSGAAPGYEPTQPQYLPTEPAKL